MSGNVLPTPEGTLAGVTLERQGSGFPKLTTNVTAQPSSFSPLPHLILSHSLLCGIFQPNMTSFSPTSPFLSYLVPASLLNTNLLQIFPCYIPPSLLGTMGRSSLRQPTQQHPLWNPIFIHSCHMPQPSQSHGCDQIFLMPKCFAICTVLRCSVRCCAAVIPRIPFRHLLWKTSNLLKASLLVVQVSEPYRSTPRTTALYTFFLVLRDRSQFLKIGSSNAPKALLALAILSPTSCAIPPLA